MFTTTVRDGRVPRLYDFQTQMRNSPGWSTLWREPLRQNSPFACAYLCTLGDSSQTVETTCWLTTIVWTQSNQLVKVLKRR